MGRLCAVPSLLPLRTLAQGGSLLKTGVAHLSLSLPAITLSLSLSPSSRRWRTSGSRRRRKIRLQGPRKGRERRQLLEKCKKKSGEGTNTLNAVRPAQLL